MLLVNKQPLSKTITIYHFTFSFIFFLCSVTHIITPSSELTVKLLGSIRVLDVFIHRPKTLPRLKRISRMSAELSMVWCWLLLSDGAFPPMWCWCLIKNQFHAFQPLQKIPIKLLVQKLEPLMSLDIGGATTRSSMLSRTQDVMT